jgi:hypothetical protein
MIVSTKQRRVFSMKQEWTKRGFSLGKGIGSDEKKRGGEGK